MTDLFHALPPGPFRIFLLLLLCATCISAAYYFYRYIEERRLHYGLSYYGLPFWLTILGLAQMVLAAYYDPEFIAHFHTSLLILLACLAIASVYLFLKTRNLALALFFPTLTIVLALTRWITAGIVKGNKKTARLNRIREDVHVREEAKKFNH